MIFILAFIYNDKASQIQTNNRTEHFIYLNLSILIWLIIGNTYI